MIFGPIAKLAGIPVLYYLRGRIASTGHWCSGGLDWLMFVASIIE